MGPPILLLLLSLFSSTSGRDFFGGRGRRPHLMLCGMSHTEIGCFNTCRDTCRHPTRSVDSICHEDCQQDMCVCEEGYLVNEGRCVKTENCPVNYCGVNETVVPYASLTQPTCDDPVPTYFKEISQLDACVCKEGYLRNNVGECILADDCPESGSWKMSQQDEPTECKDPNETLMCFNSCQNSCSHPDKMLNSRCYETCDRRQCRCRDGYYRHRGKCYQLEKCPAICSSNETLLICGAPIEASCFNPNPIMSMDVCLYNSCKCQAGYLRDDVTGRCVDPSDCTKNWKPPRRS